MLPQLFALLENSQARGVVATVDVTIAASGYSSFSSAADLDFTAVTNASSLTDFKAYVASAANGSAVTLTQVDEAPAATGLIIQGTGGET